MFWQKCGIAGNKPKCGISRTIVGRLTPMCYYVSESGKHESGRARGNLLAIVTTAKEKLSSLSKLQNTSSDLASQKYDDHSHEQCNRETCRQRFQESSIRWWCFRDRFRRKKYAIYANWTRALLRLERTMNLLCQ